MPKLKLTIEDVQVLKSGVNSKTGKAWTLFKFTIKPVKIGERVYANFTSFNGHEKGEVEVDVVEKMNGQWWNLNEDSTSRAGKLETRLEQLERDVAELKKLAQRTNPEIPVINEDEVDPELEF